MDCVSNGASKWYLTLSSTYERCPYTAHYILNIFKPIQMADYNFKYMFLYDNSCILIEISLNCVAKSPIDNSAALVQVMAWRRIAISHYQNKCWPNSLTHICGTRRRWVYRHWSSWGLNRLHIFSLIMTVCTAPFSMALSFFWKCWNNAIDKNRARNVHYPTGFLK